MTHTLPPQGRQASKLLRARMWLAQVLAFVAFGLVGLIKLFKPIPELAAMWPWTRELPAAVVRSLGKISLGFRSPFENRRSLGLVV